MLPLWSLVVLGAVSMAASPRVARRAQAQPLVVEAEGAALCPDRVVGELSYALALGDGTPEEIRALQQHYGEEVARWAVCARVRQLRSFRLPQVDDPLGSGLVAASLTEPGRRARVEAIQAAADALPVASAVLALEELAVLEVIGRAEPQRRVALAAAALGAWGCPGAVAWETPSEGLEAAWCLDRRPVETLATAGMQAVLELARPASGAAGESWLLSATAAERAAWWDGIESVWFPLEEPSPIRVPDGGRGPRLEPDLGWSGRVGPDLVAWQERPAFRMTRGGLDLRSPTLRSRPPSDWDGAPLLYIDPEVRMGRLASVLREAGVGLPRFVARAPGATSDRDRVVLRLHHRGLAVPPPGAAVVEVRALGGSLAAMRRTVEKAEGTGPVWLWVHPGVRYGDLVAVHAAVVGLREGPVRMSLWTPDTQSGPPER